MNDKEKVIKGLECHQIDNNHRINCADCPYYVDDDNHIQCVNDLHEDALALLKEQEPTTFKPHYIDTYSKHFICGVECGSCHKEISGTYHYCPFCGRSVKWDVSN